jgi:putative addiction module component (TIGR02574 family)
MGVAPFDFSQLSPEQRLELIEALWDSLSPDELPIPPELAAELDRRLALHRQDPTRGRPWREAMDDLEQHLK